MKQKFKGPIRIVANKKWQEKFIIIGYELAREGLTETSISNAMGISKPTFISWEKKYPLFKEAIQRGRAYTRRIVRPYTDVMNTIYTQLPDDLKELWAKINQFNMSGGGRKRIDALFANKGMRIRQRMFLCALIKCNFNISAACRMLSINRATVDLWRRDPKFHRLIDQILEIEKDWAQSCYRTLVQAGDPAATINYNRALNKDRGLDDRPTSLDINVRGQIEHKHVVEMEGLNLPLNIQKLILQKVREQKKLVESTVVEKPL